jgi:photosystem II stability/assembly factor-like uncharacterized protein
MRSIWELASRPGGRHCETEGGKDRKKVFLMKKNKLFMIEMLTVALAFGLVLGDCDNGPTSDDDDSGGGGGTPLKWTAVADPKFEFGVPANGVASSGGGTFVAVGDSGKAAYSKDGGKNWTTTGGGFISNDNISTIAYGAYDGGTFVAVSDNGKAAYSADSGKTWTPVTDPGFSSAINGIAYGGGTFVAVGGEEVPDGNSSGMVAYSADGGITWEAAVIKFNNVPIKGIAYGGGTFVAVGGNRTVAYSADGGKTWTAAAVPKLDPEASINGIAYGGGTFVLVTSSGEIAYSNNQ